MDLLESSGNPGMIHPVGASCWYGCATLDRRRELGHEVTARVALPSVLLMEPNLMKKLASLFALSALGLFAVGCNDTATTEGPEPVPADVSSDSGAPSSEGGSTTVDEGGAVDEAPPVTNEAPPTLAPTPDNSDASATPDASAEKPADEQPAPDSTEPAPAGESTPQ
jgi:hypothetical protein